MNDEELYVRSKHKVILSDLLFFIYNKFLNTPKNVIVETCVSFYDEQTIWNEKVKFFAAIGKKANPRRTNDKNAKYVEDIVSEIEVRDATNAFLPVFAAHRLHNLPHSQDGAVSNAQILVCRLKGMAELV